MALIILPRSADADVATAQAKLQAVIDAPFTVLMIVYGEGPDVERAIETCTGRVLAKPAIRRVVWCPDVEVLSADQRVNFFRDKKAAVSVGLADAVAESLTVKQAQVRLLVESAFVAAEHQLP